MGNPMSVISTHDQIYSSRLATAYDRSVLYDQDISLAEDPDFYRILMSDMKFSGIWRQLQYEIAASGYMIQPGSRSKASSLKARIVTSILKKSNLHEAILELTKAIMMGRAYAYPEGRGKIASHCGTFPQDWWTVLDIKDIDKQRVSLRPKKVWVNPDGCVADVISSDPNAKPPIPRDINGGYQIRVSRWLSDPADSGQYKPMSNAYSANLIELVFTDEEARLGMGLGLAEAAYMGLRAKAIVLRAGLKGVTKWAEELLVGMIDPNRPASKGKTNLNLAQDLLTKLANMREGNVMVVPQGLTDIKSIASTGTGHQMVMEMMNYIDDSFRECCGLAVPGGNDAQKTGAGLKVGQQKTNKAVQHHRNVIQACLNRTLIASICRYNHQQFASTFEIDAILDDSEDPVLTIVDDAQNDPEKMTALIKEAREMVDIPLEWAHDRMEIPMPADGEPIMEKKAPEPSPFGASGGTPGEDPDDPNAEESGNKFEGREDSKKESDHDSGEAAQKQKERGNPNSAAYAQRNDDELVERIVARLGQLRDPAPVSQPAPIHVHAHMPELPDVQAAKDSEAKYKSQIESMIASRDKDRAAYVASLDREIVVNVAAPVVNLSPAVNNITTPEVVVNMKPLISVDPVINIDVKAAEAPDVRVVNPARRRQIMIERNSEGKVTGASVTESAAT